MVAVNAAESPSASGDGTTDRVILGVALPTVSRELRARQCLAVCNCRVGGLARGHEGVGQVHVQRTGRQPVRPR